jgi:holliday junction DNA helicase RuvA
MYAYIKGRFTYKSPTDVYIEATSGVGYHLHISLLTYSKIEKMEEGMLYTYLNVKEDDLSLYGFFDLEEKALFTHLLSVSGIGTNTARIILSSMSPLEIRTAIVTENDIAFNKVKGVGPKTAKRIILDLKDKLRKTGDAIDSNIVLTNDIGEEAIQALVALGFIKQKVGVVISKLDRSKFTTVESMIKAALSQLT